MALIRPLSRAANPKILVVGGGIAGITAALDAAAAGLAVTVAEAGPAIGGAMARLDKTFPTNDCAMCILSPKMLEAFHHPLITLETSTRVLKVRGEAGDFQVLLHRRPRYVQVADCSGCGDCARVCPVTVPDPYNLGLTVGKAIQLPFPQAIPAAAYLRADACRVFQGKKCSACVQVCPAGAIHLEDTGAEWLESFGAIIVASGTNMAPARDFPGFGHQDVVTNLEFERLLSATGPHGGKLLRPSDATEPARLAFIQCVGSRDPEGGAAYCSSVCCMVSLKEALVAQELSGGRAAATLFYMDLRAQGKGYEGYLDQAVRRGITLVRSRVTGVTPRPAGGVEIRFSDPTGQPLTETFDLAVLAAGLRPGEDAPAQATALGVAVNSHGFIAASPLMPMLTGRPGIYACGTATEPRDIPESVITAGAAAAAASRLLTTAPRTWAPEISPPPGTPADQIPRIGVFLCHCGTNIAKVVDLAQVAAAAAKLPGVAHVEDRLFTCAVESTRQMADTIRTQQLNRVVVAACSPRTHERVFREVLIEAGLNPGYFAFANIREQCAWVHREDQEAATAKVAALVAMAVRRAAALTPVAARRSPVIPRALVLGGGVAGLSAALALGDQGFHTYLVERERTLGGLARGLYFTLEGPDPQEFLQELEAAVYRHPNVEVLTRTELTQVEGHAGRFVSRVRRQTQEGIRQRRLEHGIILLATGGQEFNPQGLHLYGADPRVLTQRELEERLHLDAPELAQLRRVVMIQCVGSRDQNHPYCSRLCCSQALKTGLLLKERYPLLEVTVLYRDLRAYGFKEDYYVRAKNLGVKFLPFNPSHPPRVSAAKRRPLTVWLHDELLKAEVPLSAELLVLSTGLEPATDAPVASRMLKVAQNTDGFFLEAHVKLRPVEAATDGIFLAGLAHYPKSLGETVAQAQAAAVRAAGILFQTEIAGSEVVAAIDPGRCRRCLACLRVCPFGSLTCTGSQPEVRPETCRGCGVCAAECPAGAISLSRFTGPEVAAQLAAALS